MKKPSTMNLTAQMQGRKLNIHQRADALIEFNKLMEYADYAETKFNNISLAGVSQQRELLNPFAFYMVKNSNPNDGMTYKDYVEQWLSI